MTLTRQALSQSPEPLIVQLACRGDRQAFEELVRRHQSWLRNLLRRLSRDAALADDLAQQAFLQAWRRLEQLQQATVFAGWLKRIALNVWLQHQRRHDPLAGSTEFDTDLPTTQPGHGMAIDIDHALALLPPPVRLCIVLSYHEHMSHIEIAEAAGLPLGTVKSHIRRGTERLRQLLGDYSDAPTLEVRP
ncbi:MAG TPA: sigma-70 family RNA polymerase sigma factor [Hyphomicrobiales bacterium]|nr:sigma-70 family RNA polymerase sigma factor [Hyphomicrobiales bacterium]